MNASDGKFYLYVGRLTLTGRFEMGYNVTCKPDGVDPEDINFMSRSRKRRWVVWAGVCGVRVCERGSDSVLCVSSWCVGEGQVLLLGVVVCGA